MNVKNFMKQITFACPIFFIFCILVLGLNSCSTDFEMEPISKTDNQKVIIEKISFNKLLQHIRSDKVKSNVTAAQENLKLLAGRGIESDTLYFTKIVKENEYTTYLLELNSYSIADPYFLKFVITQTDREEKAGYIKYIPDHEIPYIELSNFTGTIQMLDNTFTVRSENYFIKSIVQESQRSDVAARGIDGCTSSTRIIPHNCGNEGNHPPGTACGDGNFYSYFEIKITVLCPEIFPTYDNSALPNEFMDIRGPGGGGGGNAPIIIPKDPCDLIAKLNNDVLFNQKMKNLQTATNYNFELVSTAYKNPTPNSVPTSDFRFLDFQGSANTPSVSYPFYPQIEGIMHSHYEGLLSIYSVADLADIYNKLLNPNVTDDFFSALVTKAGTKYLILIKNRAQFIVFGDLYLADLRKQKKLALAYKKNNITENSSKETNEKGFMKLMTDLNTGLSTYRGSTNFNDWQKLSYSNTTNQVTTSGCN